MAKRLNLITTIAIFIAILLSIITTLLDTKYQKQQFQFEINTLENSIKDEYKKRLQESVFHTITFIDVLYNNKLQEQSKSGIRDKELSEENKKQFLDDIRSFLYANIFEKSRYTWINKVLDFNGGDNYAIRLIHPNLKNTEGVFLSTKSKDIQGNAPYLEELEGIKNSGEIYFTYYFKQIDKDEVTEKFSYAKLYKRFDWIIATGIPLNTLNSVINKQKLKIKKAYDKHLINVYIFRILILFVFILMLLFLRKKLIATLNENKKLNKILKNRLKTVETNLNKFFELPTNLLVIGKYDGEILQVNPGWKSILGYEKHELIHKNFIEFVHPNDIEKIKSEMQVLGKEEITIVSQSRIRTKNGKYKDLIWSVTSFPKDELIYGTAQDITELKEKTNLIYQQSKMAAIGEMTANIAHQWRQPLSIISTAASGVLVKKDIDSLDDKFLNDTMNQITESTKYLSQTIEDFRNFFSPHKEKSDFLINSLIDKTLNLLEKRFNSQGIKIIRNIENIRMNNYENELLQVILNLFNNARDQLVKENIEDKYIFVNAYKKGDKTYIEVIDNGNGISDDIIERVFEPYFTTKEKSIGTGIGLYMSEEIVTKHLKGRLKVKNSNFEYNNRKYIGAQFTITLD